MSAKKAHPVSTCSCEDCRDHRARLQLRANDRRHGTLAPDDPRHGTLNGYCNYGCRESCCAAAKAAANARRYRR